MKKIHTLIVVLLMVIGTMTTAQAHPIPGTLNLYDRGRGLIYDADLNITWLQDAGMGGMKNWYDAMTWANDLVYRGYDDWRLPATGSSDPESWTGREGEFGHLYYTELGNSGGPWTLPKVGPFINLEPYVYWSDTGFSPNPDFAWMFYFGFDRAGLWSTDVKIRDFYAWAVRGGDVAVPEPTTMLLLSLGLAGIAGLRRKIRQ